MVQNEHRAAGDGAHRPAEAGLHLGVHAGHRHPQERAEHPQGGEAPQPGQVARGGAERDHRGQLVHLRLPSAQVPAAAGRDHPIRKLPVQIHRCGREQEQSGDVPAQNRLDASAARGDQAPPLLSEHRAAEDPARHHQDEQPAAVPEQGVHLHRAGVRKPPHRGAWGGAGAGYQYQRGERQAGGAHPPAAASGALRPAGRGLPEPRGRVQPAPGHHEGAAAHHGGHLQRGRRDPRGQPVRGGGGGEPGRQERPHGADGVPVREPHPAAVRGRERRGHAHRGQAQVGRLQDRPQPRPRGDLRLHRLHQDPLQGHE
mmetsp:Transcript_21443/g.47026  ORF Transcript_21443/g.47026 Transcript_21443/m.47026 type:complete len:314 (-) Transcript_21443:610-1551(-)